MRDDLPVWRSLLFVPVTAEKFVRTGADRGADGIILDLEDAVAPSQKANARTLIEAAIPQVARNGADVLVRVNRPWRLFVRDLEAAVIPGVKALMLTKVDSVEHVLAAAEIVAELEAERGLSVGALQFVVLVETAVGYFRLAEIARSHPRVVAISLGTEDFTADVGMLPDPEGLFFPKQQTVFAARAAGILPMGFVGIDRRLPRPGRVPCHRAPLQAAWFHGRERDPPAAGSGAQRRVRRHRGRGGAGGAHGRRLRRGVCAGPGRRAVRGRHDRRAGSATGEERADPGGRDPETDRLSGAR